ncbi:MAG: RNA pseudouridine synthase [Candidatus Dojkabacteria bacterium]|nr:RNA pseudouridine synthase [Candidatus Dojkabacteria bacterium]
MSKSNNPGDKRYVNTKSKRGKAAITEVRFRDTFEFGRIKCSVLNLEPKTGRTHQLRVHLSSIGNPILGDELYGGRHYRRLMLHAYSLKFILYGSDDVIEAIADIPKDFS